jgi:hypothetical protein
VAAGSSSALRVVSVCLALLPGYADEDLRGAVAVQIRSATRDELQSAVKGGPI